MSIAAVTTLAFDHLTAELSDHAGGVGDGEAHENAAGVSGYPYHILWNISQLVDDDTFLNDGGMFSVTLQVTTAAESRILRDLAADVVYGAMMNDPVSSVATAGGETLTVFERSFGTRAPDDLQAGRVFSVAQRFVWTCSVG